MPVVTRCLMFLLAAAHVWLGPAAASRDTAAVAELDEIVVRATRQHRFSSDVIDSTEISRPRESKTAEGVLTNLAGIDVQRSSPAAGKGIAVSIRGLDESRSLILLNGRPLNGAGVMGGDYVDWSLLPADDISRIEVIRGVKSAEYGNTIGGVVNIITRRDMTRPPATRISTSYGIVSPSHAKDALENRATGVSVVHHANILNTAALDLFAGYSHGEPYLRNNYYDRTGFGGELSVKLPLEFRASAGFRTTQHDRGFAVANTAGTADWDPDFPESKEYGGGGPELPWKGGDYYYGDRSFWKNNRTQADFSLQKIFPSLTVTALAHVNDQDRTEYFYALTDTNTLVLERYAKPEDNTLGWNLIVRQNLSNNHLLKYGVEETSLRYRGADIRECDTSFFQWQPDEGNADETVRAADRYGLFFQSFLNFGERFDITPGIRYDRYIGFARTALSEETPFNGVSPNCGITVKVWEGGKIDIQGAYAHRFPTCPELYWYYAGYTPSDRQKLSPERALQAELGISQSLEKTAWLKGSLGVRGYHYSVKDYIRTIFGYRPSRLIYNIEKAVLAGLEFEASLTLRNVVSLRANYTFQKTEKRGDTYDSSIVLTRGLPELPEHKANVGINYKTPHGAEAGLSVRFIGRKAVITGNPAMGNATSLEYADAFATARLYASLPVWTHDAFSAKVRFGVDNLFDTEYEEKPGIPMPGITGTGALEVSF